MHGDLNLAQRETQLRRQADEHYARQWRLGNLARPPSQGRLQIRSRLAGLANAAIRRLNTWLAGPSEPQEQCC